MPEVPEAPRWKRLAWFLALWAAGVVTVMALGYVLKWVIPG
jgi:hypothetical protein